jgi:hypothetical protein
MYAATPVNVMGTKAELIETKEVGRLHYCAQAVRSIHRSTGEPPCINAQKVEGKRLYFGSAKLGEGKCPAK